MPAQMEYTAIAFSQNTVPPSPKVLRLCFGFSTLVFFDWVHYVQHPLTTDHSKATKSCALPSARLSRSWCRAAVLHGESE